ncbi:hypothetical protein [Marilutibacter maris]|uniref:hypothetical protein n=1 Tax=Marilutibacter maris TaxID=1605891 RepID=UPI0011AE47DF|nr:hypothetical protein [Lysobacter maris]
MNDKYPRLMDISFDGPTFFAQEDENRFFNWIYALPAYEEIRGRGTMLDLKLCDPVDVDTTTQLLVIFRRWRIDVEPLLPLKTGEVAGHALWESDLVEAGEMRGDD